MLTLPVHGCGVGEGKDGAQLVGFAWGRRLTHVWPLCHSVSAPILFPNEISLSFELVNAYILHANPLTLHVYYGHLLDALSLRDVEVMVVFLNGGQNRAFRQCTPYNALL